MLRLFLKRMSVSILVVLLILMTALAVAAADSNLPGGTSISVDISSPGNGATIPETDLSIALSGSSSIGEGVPVPNTLLVYVMDVSGSANTIGNGCGGDQNGDGRSNTVLDCEIDAAIALNNDAAAAGNIGEVGVAVFSRLSAAGDVDPVSGIQLLTGPSTDADGNLINDAEDVLRSASAGTSPFGSPPFGIHLFSPLSTVAGHTNYSAGIEAALDIANASSLPNKLIIFMSDGAATFGPNINTLQGAVVASGAVFNTFAVGNAAQITCDTNPSGRGSLRDLAQLSDPDGECFEVGSVAELPDILPTVIQSTLSSLELSIDGGTGIDISASSSPLLPENGPANASFSTIFANLLPGSHQLCVTAYGSDAGGEGEVTDCVDVTVNSAPTANAGSAYSGTETNPIALLGTVSDVDGPGLTIGWTYSGPALCTFSAPSSLSTDFTCADSGAYTVFLTADDGINAPTTASASVVVNNIAPTVDAGAAQTVSVGGIVNLLGSFMDPAGSADNPYNWSWDLDGDSLADASGSAAYGDGLSASTSFGSAGTYILTLTVMDKDGDSGSDTVEITVNSPPVCSAAIPSVDSLWPPDHSLTSINVLGVIDPDGDAVSIVINSIFQDEPTNGLGDGDTSPDAFGIGTDTAEIRAERDGSGNGRYYHISFTASDPYGGTCSGLVQVSVDHSLGKSGAAVDDGALFDSTLP